MMNLLLESVVVIVLEFIAKCLLWPFMIALFIVCIAMILALIAGIVFLVGALIKIAIEKIVEDYKSDGILGALKTILLICCGGFVLVLIFLPDIIECWENITKGYRVWEGDVDGKHIKMQMRRGPLYDEKENRWAARQLRNANGHASKKARGAIYSPRWCLVSDPAA